MFSGTVSDTLFSFYTGTSSVLPQILGKSTLWDSVSFSISDWESPTGTFVGLGTVANIRLEGHYWDVTEGTGLGTGSVANLDANPILSGGSTVGIFPSLVPCWDTYNPGENQPIGYVGQSLKSKTHLIATFLTSCSQGVPQIDMSFDHVFLEVSNPID